MNRTYSHESPSVLDVRDPYSEFYQGPHHGKHWYLWHPDDIGTAKPMNEVEWFKAFQPLLLKVVNSGYGRQLMGIDADLPPIHLITKNALHCDLGDGRKLYEVRVGAKWANVIRYRWPEFKRYARFFYDMPNFFTLLDMKGVLVPAHATSTFYPDPDTESTTVDGYLERTASRDSFATTRNGAGTASNDTQASSTWAYMSYRDDDYLSDDTERMRRNPCLFDVSSIASGTGLTSASISLVFVSTGFSTSYVTVGQGDVLLDFTVCAPASDTALVNADYNIANWTDTSLARGTQDLDQETGDDSTYTAYAFNSAGMTALSSALGGILKIGSRLDRDTDSVAPLANTIANYGQNGGNSGCGIHAYLADETGTGKDPKLTVVDASVDAQALNGIAIANIQAVNGITPANGEAINGITF